LIPAALRELGPVCVLCLGADGNPLLQALRIIHDRLIARYKATIMVIAAMTIQFWKGTPNSSNF
jgi:hypothetical protein